MRYSQSFVQCLAILLRLDFGGDVAHHRGHHHSRHRSLAVRFECDARVVTSRASIKKSATLTFKAETLLNSSIEILDVT